MSLHSSVALSLCTTAHPLYTRFANIFGASISETTMRPNSTGGFRDGHHLRHRQPEDDAPRVPHAGSAPARGGFFEGALSTSHRESALCGGFVRARWALTAKRGGSRPGRPWHCHAKRWVGWLMRWVGWAELKFGVDTAAGWALEEIDQVPCESSPMTVHPCPTSHPGRLLHRALSPQWHLVARVNSWSTLGRRVITASDRVRSVRTTVQGGSRGPVPDPRCCAPQGQENQMASCGFGGGLHA